MYAVGDVVRGQTTKHPGKLEITSVSAQYYGTAVVGGQHDSKRERYVPRHIIENNYVLMKAKKQKVKGRRV